MSKRQAEYLAELLETTMEHERIAGRCEHVPHFGIHVDESQAESAKAFIKIREMLGLPTKRYTDLGWVVYNDGEGCEP